MRALIADDDRDARGLAVRALRKEFAEFDPVEITDAASFALALAGPEPAFLITDLDLHWIDGLSLFRQVRERFPYCAAVMLTATGSEEKAVQALKHGFDDYIVKRQSRMKYIGPSVRNALVRQQQRRELKITKDDLLAAVEEKEELLKELYHRTSNNLQLVITLNLLEADRFTDPVVRGAFDRVNSRIAALAALQEKFYRAEDLGAIILPEYLRALAEAVVGNGGLVHLKMDMEPIEVPLGRAIPLALIVNEILINAMKHAFPRGGDDGQVTLSLSRAGDGATIMISDNGVGMARGSSSREGGLHLLRRLAGQARAAIDFPDVAVGTTCIISFPVD